MSKHLQAVVKECREILEKDVGLRYPDAAPCSVTETAWTILLELSLIRCFEEQIWKIPTHFAFASHSKQFVTQLTLSRQRLREELSHIPFTPPLPPSREEYFGEFLSRTVLYHLVITITPDEWRSGHILGWIYQYFQDTPQQKRHGQFYTPEPVADYIVSQAFKMVLNGPQRAGEDFHILDLACGCGAFALRAFEHLYDYYKDGSHSDRLHLQGGVHLRIPRQILTNHLFLVDNDPWACQIAAINLYSKAKRLEPECQIERMNIFCADALQRWEHLSPSPDPSHQGRGNLTPLPWWKGQGEWEQIKKVFTRRYDLVVGNPPYIVINQLKTPQAQVKIYKSYQTAAFKINTFALFVERGIELLKPGGTLGMIVPNTCLTQIYFEPLRTYILNTCKIRQILDTKRVFDNAFVENGILLLQHEPDESRRSLNIIECSMKDVKRNPRQSPRMIKKPVSSGRQTSIPQHYFEKAPLNMFNVHIDEPTFALMEKIANGNPKLGEICESHDGVNPGNAKHKLIVAEHVDETCKKVLNGKNIGRYWLTWGGLYVRYDKSLLTKGDNVRWGHRVALDSPKILTRQTADQIIGTFEQGEYYTTNSIHTTILQDNVREFDLKYILALFNSKLLSFYYRKLISEVGQVFSQVKLVNLRQLPLKQAAVGQQKGIRTSVDELLQGMHDVPTSGSHPLASGIQPSLFSSLHRRVVCKDKRQRHEMLLCHVQEKHDRLDHTIYECYHLTKQEINLIEQEMGGAMCLYPKVSGDALEKEISFETFQQRYYTNSQTIFQIAEHYQIHPISLLELRKRYNL